MRLLNQIRRNRQTLAHTEFCLETPDGGLTLTPPDGVRYDLAPAEIADAAGFAETWSRLLDKPWFTPEVAMDLLNVIMARWLAKARGWL